MKTVTLTIPNVQLDLDVGPAPAAPMPRYSDPDTVWLAPGGSATHPGVGTAEDPFRVATPQEFDGVFRSRWPKPTTFRLYPGEYWSQGSWAFPEQDYCHFSSGSHLRGVGASRTFLRLADEAIFSTEGRPRPDANVLWIGRAYGNDADFSVADLTIDGRESAFGDQNFVLSGVRFWGNRVRCQRVRVTGLRGSYSRELESFGISTINHPGGDPVVPDGDALIDDCEVVNVAPSAYVSSFSIGYRPFEKPIVWSAVTRCRALAGRDNHFAFAACHRTQFHLCSASGVRYGFYNDTDSAQDWIIDACAIETHYSGLQLISAQLEGNQDKRHIRLANSAFDYAPVRSDTDCLGLGLIEARSTPSHFDEIVVEGCTFRVPEGRRFVLVSSNAPGVGAARVVNSIVPANASVHATLSAVKKNIVTRSNWTSQGRPANDALPPTTA